VHTEFSKLTEKCWSGARANCSHGKRWMNTASGN